MRGRSALAILLAILLSIPVVGGTTSTVMEDDDDENPCAEKPEQPCENQTTLYFWTNGQSSFWSHFNPVDAENTASNNYSEEEDSGTISIDKRFSMKPSLSKRLSMIEDGEVRVVLDIKVEGDWTNDNDADSACGQNDCEELNITLWAGATKIFRQHYPGLSQGENTVMFTYRITEEQTLWDASTANPSLQIEMKLKGNYNNNAGPGGLFVEGDAALFEMTKEIFSNGVKIFVKKALPLTIVTALLYLLAVVYLSNSYGLNNIIIQVIFIGLASLTFPHILLEYLLEKNEKQT